MQCILVDGPTLGFQHNGYSLMGNLFQNTFKSQDRAITQNALHLQKP